jgi:F420-dependent oxidoreductase-like protein
MRFSVWPGAHQSWNDIVHLARHAETTGWDGIWFADHFLPSTPDGGGRVLECWTVLAGLAATVPRVRLGALVSGNTYRHPAVLTNIATAVDHISDGRVVLGLGAGWQENEHLAYGIPYYDTGERLARLDEACQVIRALFGSERANFEGRYYQLQDAPLEPKPVQQRLPLLIGGGGEKVTLRIAARYADEWNAWGTPETFRHKSAVLDDHCAAVGRDPAEIARSTQALVFMSDDHDWLASRRAAGIDRAAIIGTPLEVRAALEEYAAAGLDEFIVPDFNLGRPERKVATLDRFIAEVAAPLR